MVIKKGSAVGAVVVLMLCVAVYLNWSYSRSSEDLSAASDVEAGKILGEAQLVEEQTDGNSTTKDATDKTKEDEKADSQYFARARLTRQRARDEAMNILKETAANQKIEQTARDKASEELTSMASTAMREARIENLIVAKGYTDCVVSINDTGISVVVKSPSGGLKAQDAAKIQDIVMGEVTVSAEKIKIIETY
ncbi:MAG: SpoIIIAH-like family protein [Clostridiales bacterium]|nr:SpoIIIAH-like family protein [Clostridiales bacterium]